jgi:transcriptional regulator with XRE-family HTH domain
MNIGKRVREAREDLGMQRTVLARRVGVAENTIYRIETAKRMPSVELLEKIARELRTEPAEFLREPVPLADTPQETGQPEVKGPDPKVWGDEESRPKPLPKSDVTHHVEVHEKITVSDHAKAQLKEHFDALIHDLENIRRSKEAAELARMRDEVLAAVV